LRDRLLRSLADAENTRRRAERSAADARQYAISDFAAELLAVVDNLQRATASAEGRPEQMPLEAALLEGVRATERLLLATLNRFGVRKIDALGALVGNSQSATAEGWVSTLRPGSQAPVSMTSHCTCHRSSRKRESLTVPIFLSRTADGRPFSAERAKIRRFFEHLTLLSCS
jgi:GrpE